MTDKKSGQPESSERDALDRGEHSECEEGEVFDSTSTTPTPTDDRGDMIEVGDVDFKSEDIEQSDCDNETNNDQEMPASTQQEVPDDQQGKETRAERKMRRKLKKERKKAEKYAADLINDGHQKKKKKRKIREDEDSSPQKKSKIDTSEMESTSSDLTTEDKLLLKLEKKKKVNKLMQLPKIFLTLQEIYGRAIEKEDAIIPPLDIKNIQDLVLYSLIGMNASVIPRWCKILRWTKISSVVMVVLNSVSQEHFEKYPECFTNTRAIFDMSVPVIPSKNSFIYDFLYVPLSKTKIKKLMNSDEKDKQNGGIMNEFNNGDESDFDDVRLPDRRGYVLTQEMMMMNGFPTENEKNFKSTNYSETLSKDSPMFGLDCEMCQTKKGHELTRISLVDEKYNVLYDTLVKPKRPIIDYLTQYSGVTKEMLDPIETRLKDVQQKLISLLPPDAILVGHSLESDLQAIKMYHPNVIDTSVLFIGRNQHKLSLRNLSAVYLKKSIQGGIDGHDSIEDANAAMKLVQLKIEKGPSLQSYHDMTRRQVESFFRTIYREDVDGSMLDNISNVRQFKSDPVSTIPCCNDKEALRKLPGALHLGKFTWLQLHSLNTVLQGVTLDDNTISDTLKRLDERVKDVLDALPLKSLYIVMMNGEGCTLGRCFMTLKLPSVD